MEAELQTHVAFHLTGKRPASDLDAIEPLALLPALLARYRDLSSLRYDFPVVLAEGDGASPYVEALSALVDRTLQQVAQGDDGDRVSHRVMRLETAMRAMLAAGENGTLSAVWTAAVAKLGTGDIAESLAKARAAIKVDGELVDCNAALAPKLLAHAAQRVYARKAAQFRAEVERLVQKLSDILQADFVRSGSGRSADNLRAAVGTLHDDSFDFDAMSSILTHAAPDSAMPEARRKRIRGLLDVLQSQRFYAMDGSAAPYAFTFANCQQALSAYRTRIPEVVGVARAIAVAELEIAGEYKETRHDAYFDDFGEEDLDPKDLALFPDYLVCTSSAKLDAVENSTLMEMLSSGLPMKVLVQAEDILDETHPGDAHFGFGARNRQLTHMAMGLNEVYVLQSSASNLFRYRDAIVRGLEFGGPALFSCYCPQPSSALLPPYLVAAAAMESRAFPAFTYDPSAGADWASRFDLDANPQVTQDWPVQRFEYEDANHQRVPDDLAFTLVDFVACDARFLRHFARVPRTKWSTAMTPVAAVLASGNPRQAGVVPCSLMVDAENRLQKVIVDEKLMREARRCRDMWHSLQELGGVNNSHAERLLARERAAREEDARKAAETQAKAPAGAAQAGAASAAAEAAAAPVAEVPSDDPYIETPRCTSCNECTNLNNKLFGYDENKQAFIADASAGTYAQLVEAAENCQVSIIHPGKPRNAKEPGLEALLERAKPFL